MAISEFTINTQYSAYEGVVLEEYIIADVMAMYEDEKITSMQIKQSGTMHDILKLPVLKGENVYYFLNLPLPQTENTALTLSWGDIWNAFDYAAQLHLAKKYGASAADCGNFLQSAGNLNALLMYYKNGTVDGGAAFDMFNISGGTDTLMLPLEIDYPLTLTCNFDAAGGLSAPLPQGEYGKQSITVTEPSAPSKGGETFLGWGLSTGGEAVTFPFTYTTQQTNGDISFTLYALWQGAIYAVEYYLDGGTNSAQNPLNYTKETSFNFYDPYKAGHTFLGWFDSAQAGNRKYGIVKNSGEGLVFYARWDKKPPAKGGYVY